MDVWYVYLLVSTDGCTYVGATVDPDRRLRQHNGEIKGGARATARKGPSWKRVCFVGPFEKIPALKFEWRWKHLSRKYRTAGKTPLENRMNALQTLIDETHTVVFSEEYADLL